MNTVKRKVILTGGGTVGHVMLNKLLIPGLINKGIEPLYIGSKKGIEKEIINATSIKYYNISSGKLRRYLSKENIKDFFKVSKGFYDARKILKREKPELVFSKGGFVSVPVVLAARSLNIPVFIHESDISPGLANKIAGRFATKIFVTFEKTLDHLPSAKAEYIGPVFRDDLGRGRNNIGFELTGFNPEKPIMLIMGGSLGSVTINKFIKDNLNELLDKWQIIHLVGYGNYDDALNQTGYKQFEFVNKELPHLMKISDTVVGRSGSNAIFEFLLNKKPMILVPLPLNQSRGDQIENAEYFKEKGFAEVIHEEQLSLSEFMQKLSAIEQHRSEIITRMKVFDGGYQPEDLVNRLLQEEGK
ncbi:undecaprenyldiphospho-muramoylpentapeptide beta-N-acetylglucosaminyltransferase [Salinicoccus albus]|uniref:undecaprenyldiphospho-muramoylpentapeptide beta-N-acetylglucosaminyltransferase n=1 Tax=Salinicoccus albus TaxID=418756 RepID=UPI00036E58A6|nr:undecaprenyldiphospho-muramoylpentapeptide beta-N-acetylglucosaminyltransferase [Salinicoccus albus]